MIDPWIIEKIKEEEREERPFLELPLEEYTEETKEVDKEKRGVLIIDL